MSLLPSDKDRHVIPRWRPTRARSSSRELLPIRPQVPTNINDEDLAAVERDFLELQTVWTAADFVSASIARGHTSKTTAEAMKFISDREFTSPALKRALARMHAGGESGAETQPLVLGELDDDIRKRVRTIRESIRLQPRNALKWVDLGLAQLTLGNSISAEKAIRAALTIAPHNRLVLRSSSRFFVHVDKPEEALHWLERSGRLQNDPWLLAAHIAVNQVVEKPLKNIRSARELLTDGSVSPFSASELNAVVASEELKAGRSRPARLLMSSALREPTENAVAQAVWSTDRGLSGLSFDHFSTPRAFEAQTLVAMQADKWEEANVAVETWLADEPFSVRAALHASYIASTGLEDYSKALEYAAIGLRTSPGHRMLTNNAAFALGNLGRLTEARHLVSSLAHADDLAQILLEATSGLISFREGHLLAGRDLYRGATEKFRKKGQMDLASLCQVMWAREEMRAGTDVGERLLDEASTLVQSGKSAAARV
jgi:tetratricopeptide (TPR) repeat protein